MIKNKLILTAALLCAAFFMSGCASKSPGYTPAGWSPLNDQIEMVLKTAGDNRGELEEFLNSCKGHPEKLQAAMFLTANLPPCDRATLSAGLLKENLDLAFAARETMPWGHDVSWTDFLHYILPHRVSQEKAVNWRGPLFKEIMPLVADCESMEKAVLEINRWCFEKTGFKSTQRWDQNPLMTVNRGVARCEEAVILLVSALRSAGIPARQAMVPAWQHSNDNHTWTEVLTESGWHYLESANPDFGLDHAWFTGSARKAPLVLSYAYGQLSHSRFPIYKRTFGCTVLNTTAQYAPTSPLEIILADREGKPLQGRVFISVFNYGTFSPVAALETNEEGKARMMLGPGSMFLSSAQGNASVFHVSTWIPGEIKKRRPARLKLVKGNMPNGEVLMRFSYNDKVALEAPAKNSEGARKKELDGLKTQRNSRFDAVSLAAERFNPDHAESIAKSGLNMPEVLRAASDCPEDYRDSFYRMLKIMEPADLTAAKAQDLMDNLLLSIRARQKAADKGIEYDDDIFFNFVLNPRIMYEQYEPWRKKLSKRIAPFNRTPKGINTLCATLRRVGRGNLGSALTPLGVLKSNSASSKGEKCIFATAALRSLGIPARYLPEQDWVEYYDGTGWLPLFPDKPEEIGNIDATPESRSYYGEWSEIYFKEPEGQDNLNPARYFKHFTLSKLRKGAYFELVEKTIQGGFNSKKKTWKLKVPDGKYWFIYGRRNKKGEPQVSITKVYFHK